MSTKLPKVTGKEAINAFSRDQFSVVRIKGAHHVMKREGHPHLLTVPVHGSEPLKSGTLRNLIRAAGMTVERFNELLD